MAQNYWNDFYSKGSFKEGPSEFLLQSEHRLKKGKLLDIAMGEGQDSLYLASKGFEVKGFDISSVAIEKVNKQAGLKALPIVAKQTDLDMYIFGIMEYDTIIMNYFKPSQRYWSEIIRALKQGGTLLIESYTSEEADLESSKHPYKDFYFNSNEILYNLKGLRILVYIEDVFNGKHGVRCLAQKPQDKDALKYNLFGMATQGSSDEKSKQYKLAEAFFKKKS